MDAIHQSVTFNYSRWTQETDWSEEGEEWSEFWGSSEAQWYGCLLPRVVSHLPAKSILEIAPGYGRWTKFLVGMAEKLTIVDLASNCIEHCKAKFSNFSHVDYFVNDGKSLSMVPDNSVDFVFSFDSLVHADLSVMESYIGELPRILTKNGVAFIHHSNAKIFASYYSTLESLPRGRGLLNRLKLSDERHLRNLSVSGDDVLDICQRNNLTCGIQERINWGGRRLIDCISTISRKSTLQSAMPVVIQNTEFMTEARHIKAAWSRYQPLRRTAS